MRLSALLGRWNEVLHVAKEQVRGKGEDACGCAPKRVKSLQAGRSRADESCKDLRRVDLVVRTAIRFNEAMLSRPTR